jgi:hypothetical protein
MSSFCRDDDGELARVLKDEQRCLARLDRTSFWIVELSHALEVQEGSQHWLRRGVSGIALFERATAVVAAFYHALAEDQGVAPHERMLDLNLQQGWNGRVSLGMLYMLWCCLRRRMSSRACKLGGSKHAAITQLIEQVDPDLKDSDGLTPLHIVAQELHMLGDAFPEMIARTWLERSTRRYALLGDALRTCVAHINDMDEEGCSEDKVTAWTRLLLSRPHQDLNTPTSVLHALVDCTQPPYATICGLVQLGPHRCIGARRFLSDGIQSHRRADRNKRRNHFQICAPDGRVSAWTRSMATRTPPGVCACAARKTHAPAHRALPACVQASLLGLTSRVFHHTFRFFVSPHNCHRSAAPRGPCGCFQHGVHTSQHTRGLG